jgi:ElaB/YqjD/DUF883 family membrane-anchored ribosome-binding protein
MVQEGGMGGIGGAVSPEVRSDVEAIKSDLAALRAEVANLVQDVVSAGKSGAGNAGSRIAEAARGRLDQVGQAWEQATEQGKQLVENIQEQIEERPLASIGIAFGTGLLLGALLRR